MTAANHQQFRASPSAYVVLCGPFVAIALLWGVTALRTGHLIAAPVLLSLGIAIGWAAWLARFRLVLRPDRFTYRAPWRSREDIPYTAVIGLADGAGGWSRHVTLRLADGTGLTVNGKVFARGAIRELLVRAAMPAPDA